MGKQDKLEHKTDTINQVYRQFSRQKYNKYKHQYPTMRQSEIVSKIIKEWDSIGKEGKEKLYNLYFSNRLITKIQQPEPDSANKSVEKANFDQKSLEKTAQKPASVKLQFKQEGSPASFGDRDVHSEHGSSRKSLQSGNNMNATTKTKKISALRNDYIAFYKYYYDKYQKQHPAWNSKQLSKVISLLWQKRKKQFKKVMCPKKENSVKIRRNINGRKLFRRIRKNQTAQEVKKEWSTLPKESKQLWSQPSKTFCQPISKTTKTLTFTCGSCQPKEQKGEENTFSFLNKLIR